MNVEELKTLLEFIPNDYEVEFEHRDHIDVPAEIQYDINNVRIVGRVKTFTLISFGEDRFRATVY